MPTVRDYGGVGGRLRPYGRKTKLRKENCYSFRCRDCSKLRQCSHWEVNRAARPRCLDCGGCLIETEPSEKRHVARMDNMAIAKGTKSEQTVGVKRKRLSKEARAVAHVRCPGCNAGFTDTTGYGKCTAHEHLESHLKANIECAAEYARLLAGVTNHD